MTRRRHPVVREAVGLYEAKTHLSALVERAAEGEEIVITKSGKPKARLVPLDDTRPLRKAGLGRGRWKVATTSTRRSPTSSWTPSTDRPPEAPARHPRPDLVGLGP